MLKRFCAFWTIYRNLSTLDTFKYQTIEIWSITYNQWGIPNELGLRNMALILLWPQDYYFCLLVSKMLFSSQRILTSYIHSCTPWPGEHTIESSAMGLATPRPQLGLTPSMWSTVLTVTNDRRKKTVSSSTRGGLDWTFGIIPSWEGGQALE